MKQYTEKELRQIFKKKHDCMIGAGDNIHIAMTEDRFIEVINELKLFAISSVSGMYSADKILEMLNVCDNIEEAKDYFSENWID